MKIRLCAFADEAGETLSNQISALKRNQISLIELRSIDGKNVLDFSFEEATHYYEILKKNEIDVFSIGSPIGKVDIDVNFEEYQEKVIKICQLAKIFHTDKVRVFSFYKAYNQRDKVLLYLKKMVDIARELGVSLYHENEKDIYGDNLNRVQDLINANLGLKFVYDPANFIQVGEEAEDTLASLSRNMDYFHIKDVIKSNGDIVPAGYGDGNIRELISMIDRDIVFTIEPHLAVFKGYSEIDKTTLKNSLYFSSNDEAFDAAVISLKNLLIESGYKNKELYFEKE